MPDIATEQARHGSSIGQPLTRRDGFLKVTGGATFAADNRPEDMAAYLASHYSPELQERELRDPSRFFLLAEVEGTPAGFALLDEGAAAPG